MITYPHTLFSYLKKNNIITVLTFQYDKKLPLKENQDGIIVERIPYHLKISKGFLSFFAPFYFLNQIRKNDVLILNIPNAEAVTLAILAKIMGKKVIAIYHCEVALGKGFLNQLISFILKLTVTIQLVCSDVIVAYTKSYAQRHIPRFLQNKIQYHFPPVEPLGINNQTLDQFRTEKKDTIYIGFAGRVAREKGLEYLIQAIGLLQQKEKTKKIILLCAGPYGNEVAGEEEYYQEIQKALNQSNITAHFLGNLKSGDLGAFYRAIDLLVLPSVNQTEAFGIVQVDAVRLGTPLVASDLPGVHEVIDVTKMGILTPPRSSKALAEAIQTVLEHKQMYVNNDLQKQAKKIFDVSHAVAFWNSLLEDIQK